MNKTIIRNRKLVIDTLYHKWGVALENDPKYRISQEDLDTMKWAKKELHKLTDPNDVVGYFKDKQSA